MIEQTLIDYLTDNGFPAFGEEPKNQPFPYYVLQRTGGGGSALLRRGTLIVQSYGASLYGAAAANNAMVYALLGAAALDAVASITLNSDYNYTDTAKKRYRYQAVFDITYYEEAQNG